MAAFLVATLLARLAAFITVQSTAPTRAVGPDTPSYVGPARALAANGRFLAAPDRMDLPETVRTPGYPAFLAFFFRLFGTTLAPAIAAQVLLSVLTAAFVFVIARDLWDARTATLSVLLLCLDPISFLASQMVLSDSLFVFLLTAALFAGCRALRSPPSSWASSLAFGTLLATATLVRPVTYYLILPALLLFGLSFAVHGHRRWELLLRVSLAALPCLVLVGGWQLRNDLVTGTSTFSHIKGVNLLEYRAAAIVAERDGISLEKARENLLRASSAGEGEPAATRLDRQARVGSAIIRSHPLLALKVQLQGLARMLLVPGEGDVLEYLGIEIPPTGVLGDLSRLPFPEFHRRWVIDNPALLAIFTLTASYLLILYGGAARAATLARRDGWQTRAPCHLLLGMVALYLLVISAGPEAYARFRLPLMPILALYAGRGLAFHSPAGRPAAAKA